MNERLLTLREYLKMSQHEFGARIGVSRFSVSNYEAGTRNITDRVVSDVCREFGVSEEWLRDGTGEMLARSDDDALDRLASELSLNEYTLQTLRAFEKLSPKNRDKVLEYITDLAAAYDVDTSNIQFAARGGGVDSVEVSNADIKKAQQLLNEREDAVCNDKDDL